MRKKLHLLFLAAALPLCATAKTEKISIQSAKGKLSAIIQTPELKDKTKCPMVMLLHGFMASKDGMIETMMAEELEKEGIASVRFDFNGHGESEGAFQDMTVLNEIEDAKKVYAYISALPYVGKIGVAGHSQGGVVSSMFVGEMGRKRVACVVLFAPAAVLRDDAIRGNVMGATYDPLNPPETIPLFNGKKLGGNYARIAFSLPIYQTAARYQGPACIIHGTADRIVPYTYGERYHEIWKRSTLHILDGLDHGFFPEPKKATSLAVNFLKAHLK